MIITDLSEIISEELEEHKVVRISGTLEEYFDLLEVYQDTEYDLLFDNGEIIVFMSYASAAHEALTANLIRLFGNLFLENETVSVYGSGRVVYVPACQKSFIPDAVIVFGKDDLFTRKKHFPALINPKIIIEVQSDTTEDFDFGQKLACYKQIPSVSEIIYVSKSDTLVSVYSPTNNPKEWRVIDYTDFAEQVKIQDFEIPVKEIYRKVVFEKKTLKAR